VGIDAWALVEELNADLAVGDVLEMPLTAVPIRVEPCDQTEPFLRKLAGNYARAAGRVAVRGDTHWVLDLQPAVFCRGALPGACASSEMVDGVFRLEFTRARFDQCAVFDERLDALPRRWLVSEIRKATCLATRVEWLEGTSVKRGMKLDAVEQVALEQESTGVWQSLKRTDRMRDDDGMAHYLLLCEDAGPV